MSVSDNEKNIELQLRLWLGRRSYRKALGPVVYRISRGRVIKGPCDLAELEAMKYVCQNTSIPVPKVYKTYTQFGRLYIEMEYIKGNSPFSSVGSGSFVSRPEKSIAQELAGFIEQLRSLSLPEEGVVASAELHGFLDHRVAYHPLGPFDNHDEFHLLLRGCKLEDCLQVYGEEVSICHSRKYRTVFTHADLAQRNIMVRDGKILSMIDWEFAGWYPEYWEYTKAHYTIGRPDWFSEFDDAVTRYDFELAAETTLWMLYDESGVPKRIARM